MKNLLNKEKINTSENKIEKVYKRNKIKLIITFVLVNVIVWYLVGIGQYHWYAGFLLTGLTGYLSYRLLPIMKSGLKQRIAEEYEDLP
ncbi:hypothetical protein [Piscirickettsia litoralis]|uniref:2TM domain-containing protein n=1 Tax=Piscirickettsia litoralis TaxID=1891921 RepID=A0ABX3A1E5_9GAMM|nr:hypothetical protein [Piscirickettsia litoralis]ODN41275.1 hypothetical protein BGC07_17050 [Piscirickettsia litoralis]